MKLARLLFSSSLILTHKNMSGGQAQFLALKSISLVRPRRRLSLAPTAGCRRRRAQIASRLAAFAATARLGLDADRARRHTCGVGANALATSQFRFPLYEADGSSRVDLRVGGGTPYKFSGAFRIAGRSPRGRRNPSGMGTPVVPLGSISAWAEEPKGWCACLDA